MSAPRSRIPQTTISEGGLHCLEGKLIDIYWQSSEHRSCIGRLRTARGHSAIFEFLEASLWQLCVVDLNVDVLDVVHDAFAPVLRLRGAREISAFEAQALNEIPSFKPVAADPSPRPWRTRPAFDDGNLDLSLFRSFETQGVPFQVIDPLNKTEPVVCFMRKGSTAVLRTCANNNFLCIDMRDIVSSELGRLGLSLPSLKVSRPVRCPSSFELAAFNTKTNP